MYHSITRSHPRGQDKGADMRLAVVEVVIVILPVPAVAVAPAAGAAVAAVAAGDARASTDRCTRTENTMGCSWSST